MNTDLKTWDFGVCVYLNTFSDLLFKLNPELKNIATRLPANAKYRSPDIQNEVIKVLRKILKRNIFTIMVDGSSDKSWWEIEGIVVRYVDASGKIEEHALDIKEALDRSAKDLLELLISSLTAEGITCDGIASQC